MKTYIECPRCASQYAPDEIFVWGELLKNKYIQKTEDSHQLKDKIQPLTEQYICDYCNCQFKVTAQLSFLTQIDEKYDFSSDHITKFKNEFILGED